MAGRSQVTRTIAAVRTALAWRQYSSTTSTHGRRLPLETEAKRRPRRRRREALRFDLARPYTRQEKAEVQDEIAEALATLPERPPKDGQESLDPAELRLKSKVALLCDLRPGHAGPVEVAQVLRRTRDCYEAAEREAKEECGRGISLQFRRWAAQESGLAAVLRRTLQLRRMLAPQALADGVCLALALLPATDPNAAEALLEALAPHAVAVRRDLPSVLGAANAVGGLPSASGLLCALLAELAEMGPMIQEQELFEVLDVLGSHVGEADPAVVEDFVESLRYVWPLCGSRTLIKALLALGQANALDVKTCRLILAELEARSEFIGRADREALLLLLALHKSAFDRTAVALGLTHPLYDEAAKKLLKELSKDAAAQISALPMENLSRPVLAMAQLGSMSRRALHSLDERLKSGRLLSLSPAAFVSLAYATRLVRGPVPREELRLPLCLAFGALLHGMEPKQVASCIESLKGYSYKEYRHVFEAAYARLASSLESQTAGLGDQRPWAILTPAEAAAAIKSFPELKFEDSRLLLRILRALSPSPLQSGSRRLASPESEGGGAADPPTESVLQLHQPTGMLARMGMVELVDILEAFGQQGLIGCGAVADAIVARYRANGGRLSRRNTARALWALAQLGERETELVELLVAELEGWEVQDPHGTDLRPRPALVALWSLCALNLVPRAAASVDWLLTFLCRETVATYVLGIRSQALLLFASLDAVRLVVPGVAARHLQALQASHSPVAEQVLLEVGRPLRSPQELLSLSGSPEPKLLESREDDKELLANSRAIEESATDATDSGGRSLLDELAIRWEMARRKKESEGLSKAKQLLGSVLAALNTAQLLRAAPHPSGDRLAAEAARGSGGFELRWPAGCYDVDWGHPFFRLGILVLSQRDFVLEASAGSIWTMPRLRATPRLRVQQLCEEGWRLVLLRAAAVDAWIVPFREEPDLFSAKLQARVVRANALYPLEVRALKKRLRRSVRDEVHDSELREQIVQQVLQQLDFIFPDGLVSAAGSVGQQEVASSAVQLQEGKKDRQHSSSSSAAEGYVVVVTVA